ncbi:MAG: hypothetical protein AB7N65_27555, partial [Vicinamibacterales bacterium]
MVRTFAKDGARRTAPAVSARGEGRRIARRPDREGGDYSTDRRVPSSDMMRSLAPETAWTTAS